MHFSERPQELAESHRAQVQVLDAADRHGEPRLAQDELQQRPGRHNGQLGQFFVQVAQRGEC